MVKLPGYYVVLINEEKILGFDFKVTNPNDLDHLKISTSSREEVVELAIRKPPRHKLRDR